MSMFIPGELYYLSPVFDVFSAVPQTEMQQVTETSGELRQQQVVSMEAHIFNSHGHLENH